MENFLVQIRRTFSSQSLEREDWEGGILGMLSLILLGLIDLCYHRQVNLSATLVMAPVLAAALARPSIVAAVGAASVGSAAGLASYDVESGGTLVKIGVVAAGAVVGMFTARHRRSLQDRALRLKSIAEAAESALLRPLPGRVGPASMAGWHVAANREARVGGDFYDAVSFGSRARWIIGDARGHGVEAIRLGAAAVGAFREAASRLEDLADVAARVEESLIGFLGEEDFVTAVFAELHRDGTLRLINCGHPRPFHLHAGDAALLEIQATTPLGIEPDLRSQTVRLAPGDSVAFHTDGLDEVRTAKGRGLDATPLGNGLRDSSADEAAEAIRRRLTDEVGSHRFQDDVSVLVVKFVPLADMSKPRLRALGGEAGGGGAAEGSASLA